MSNNERTPLVHGGTASAAAPDGDGGIVVDLPAEDYDTSVNHQAATSTTGISSKVRSQVMLGGGCCVVIFALTCAAIALIIHVGIGFAIEQTIHDSIQLVPENEEWYKMFVTNEGSEVAQYNSIVMFNLTNPDEGTQLFTGGA